jgi:hypothetical protein
MTRPQVHPAGQWDTTKKKGATWLVENAQTGRALPTSHSKRLKQKRKQGRR